MATNWAAKWNHKKAWRVEALAPDGTLVTLGRYETMEDADLDCEAIAAAGGYRNVVTRAIEQPVEPEAAAEGEPPKET